MLCAHCLEPVDLDEMEFINPQIFHYYCAVRVVVGSVGHQLRKCSCYGGKLEDPPDITKRQAALLAYLIFKASPMLHSLRPKVRQSGFIAVRIEFPRTK